MRRPVIGVPTQTLEAVPGERPTCWIMGQCYVRVLVAAGAVPWLVPLLPDDEGTLRAIYDRLDGVFLTGGVDVDPVHYGEARQSYCGATDPPRDNTELTLVRWAVADRKPVFGVCRGIQLINVALGGSLFQDVEKQFPGSLKHDYFPTPAAPQRDRLVHGVLLAAGSRLGSILGTEAVQVNSMHHQGIKKLAPGLIASAVAPDGLIEGIEQVNGHFLIGVQWHPEELVAKSPLMRRLFEAFLQAATEWATRVPGT